MLFLKSAKVIKKIPHSFAFDTLFKDPKNTSKTDVELLNKLMIMMSQEEIPKLKLSDINKLTNAMNGSNDDNCSETFIKRLV